MKKTSKFVQKEVIRWYKLMEKGIHEGGKNSKTTTRLEANVETDIYCFPILIGIDSSLLKLFFVVSKNAC